ncbi:MAG: hypothetical protein CBD88_07360 [Flavobacteriales bacterium TMED228]|nr:MAG: hypothetical protein CBD88_07360 [Flavobacteriales bacterium TMED228]|tara:strand:+ start:10536 stop:10931 length:396 start_codon:yes stop_codon:yes gene_type:complete
MDIDNQPPKRKRGRPRKTDVVSKSKGSRGAVGRPKGDAAVINEYKARMLASPKSRKVMDAIFDAALDDEHKNQAAAWKLVMDRMLPLSYFEKDSASGRSAVSITISGIGSGAVETDVTPNDPIEGEYTQDV